MVEVIDNSLMELLEKEIKETLDIRSSPRALYDIMRYHLGWLDEDLKPIEHYGGKRFRPILCLLAYYALSGVYDKALPVAAAIELIHNFSLIHDDIEDRDEERRHRPTVWKIWGEAQAINAGDGMHVFVNLSALRLQRRNVTDSKVVEVLRLLNETVMTLCEGQYLDISFEARDDVTSKEYLDMIYRKTAALIESAVVVGALLATEDEKTIADFRKFGRDLGMAFQIRDDIIGTWCEPENTGKPKGSDIENKKKTLPVIYTFENCTGEEKAELDRIYAKDRLSKEDVKHVIKLMDEKDAYNYAIETAAGYERSALAALLNLGLSSETEEKILALTDFLIKRDY
jgi:geranylgeranyl diphosphate synthase type I